MADFVKRVQILIQKPNFVDAVYLSEDQAATMSVSDFQTMADERYAAFSKMIEDAKKAPPPEPTKEELQAEADELAAKLAEVQAKIEAADVKADPIEELKP